MTAPDLANFFQWYLMLFILGALFLPLTTKIFSPFSDKGYPFAKILGMVITTYLVFNLGLARIVQFHALSIIIVVLVISVAASTLIVKKSQLSRKNIVLFLQKNWKLLLFEELLFLVSLYFLSYIRAFSPDIHGLEKYMDYGFINSIYRADYFPPKDMWFAPYSINYYYFGHLIAAVLTKIAFLKTQVTYNLMLATILAMCTTASFSIVYNLISKTSKKIARKASLFALISVFVISFGGNLHTVYTFLDPYPVENPVPPWELTFKPLSFPNAYWYPNATRFIHNTIHEFPMYSWTVSDLHGHVLDIPLVLLTIAALLSFLFKFYSQHADKYSAKNLLRYLIFIGLLISVMYMTNAWDGIIYFLLTTLLITYFVWEKGGSNRGQASFPLLSSFGLRDKFGTKKIVPWILESGIQIAIIAICFFFFSLPFSLSFKPFVSGIGVLCAPSFLTELGSFGPFLFEADHCQHSPWWQLLILHGFFYFFVISFLLFLWKTGKMYFADKFVLILILLSTILILIPEFIYAKDIYPGHYRANTMFKLVFQSFIMLSLSVGYIIFRIIMHAKEHGRKRSLWTILFFILSIIFLILIFIYPFQAIKSYYGELKSYSGLDGTKYLESLYPDDYAALEYLNTKVTGQPVILEAQGDAYNGASSYTDYARVSSNTGLPTVLGWTVHEWLWRGTYEIPAPRIEEIRLMYESDNLEETRRLLNKYNVSYVFIGALEKEKYPKLNEEKFVSIGDVVFRQNSTSIYKLLPISNSAPQSNKK